MINRALSVFIESSIGGKPIASLTCSSIRGGWADSWVSYERGSLPYLTVIARSPSAEGRRGNPNKPYKLYQLHELNKPYELLLSLLRLQSLPTQQTQQTL